MFRFCDWMHLDNVVAWGCLSCIILAISANRMDVFHTSGQYVDGEAGNHKG